MIGVPYSEPNTPPFEIVKEPPAMSSSVSFPSRAYRSSPQQQHGETTVRSTTVTTQRVPHAPSSRGLRSPVQSARSSCPPHYERRA